MFFFKLFVLSCCCCIIAFSPVAQCAEQQNALKKDTTTKETTQLTTEATTTTTTTTTTTAITPKAATSAAAIQQSAIYKIKRLDTDDKILAKQYHQQQQKQQRMLQQEDKLKLAVATKLPRMKKPKKKLTKNSHGLNKKLLSKLGFMKVKAPNSHNRKRLAIESRRHVSPDDSHMFIIKLPPNVHYYASPKAGEIGDANPKNALIPSHAETKVLNTNGKKVSFPFNSNGKPGRIYHWNLPIIKSILDDKKRFAKISNTMKDQLIDIKDIPTWSKPWENDTIEKSYGKSSSMSSYKKSLMRKSPSYYAPTNAVNKNSFNKYFAGNGKPKGFYVIKENQKKPLYYKNIVS